MAVFKFDFGQQMRLTSLSLRGNGDDWIRHGSYMWSDELYDTAAEMTAAAADSLLFNNGYGS